MGRNFDGTNDNINFGSDASVDNFFAGNGSIAFWLKRNATGFNTLFCKRNSAAAAEGWALNIAGAGGGSVLRFAVEFTGSTAAWIGSTALTSTTDFVHIAVAYNGSSTANEPLMWVNGVAETVTVAIAAVGTITADAARDLMAGEDNDGTNDMNGVMGWLNYDSTAFTAADVNRAMRWGRAKGGLKVYQPMVTDKLANEGTATANGTATGTTVIAFPTKVVRPGSWLMGQMASGW